MAEKGSLLLVKQERRDFIQNQHLERALYIYIYIYYNYYILYTISVLYTNVHSHIIQETLYRVHRLDEQCSNCSPHQTPFKTNKNEGAGSLYHPEILKKPAARPGPGHAPATAATGPGASSDTHFFQGLIDYHGWCSIGIVLPLSHRSHSSSSP